MLLYFLFINNIMLASSINDDELLEKAVRFNVSDVEFDQHVPLKGILKKTKLELSPQRDEFVVAKELSPVKELIPVIPQVVNSINGYTFFGITFASSSLYMLVALVLLVSYYLWKYHYSQSQGVSKLLKQKKLKNKKEEDEDT